MEKRKNFFSLQKKSQICIIYWKQKGIQQYLIIDELQICNHLKNTQSIEKLIDQTLDSRGFNLTVADPIGPSLKELFLLSGMSFSYQTILLIGIKIV